MSTNVFKRYKRIIISVLLDMLCIIIRRVFIPCISKRYSPEKRFFVLVITKLQDGAHPFITMYEIFCNQKCQNLFIFLQRKISCLKVIFISLDILKKLKQLNDITINTTICKYFLTRCLKLYPNVISIFNVIIVYI